MADVDYRGLAARIQIATAALIDDPTALAANGDWIGFAEISREERGVGRHDDRRIVTEAGKQPSIGDRAKRGRSVLRLYNEPRRGRLAHVFG
jgi:hypothetical protein